MGVSRGTQEGSLVHSRCYTSCCCWANLSNRTDGEGPVTRPQIKEEKAFICSKARLAFSETGDACETLTIGQSWSLDQDT